MPHEDPYCIPQDTPQGIVMSWIAERIAMLSRTYWPEELSAWAQCVESEDSSHCNEPPIPVLLGYIAEAAANPNPGPMQIDTPEHRKKLLLWGIGIAATHGNAQQFISRNRCGDLPEYVIPNQDDPYGGHPVEP